MSYYSYQTNNNILVGKGVHPQEPPNCFICDDQNIVGLDLGMRYNESDQSFYKVDENDNLIDGTAVDVSNYLGD